MLARFLIALMALMLPAQVFAQSLEGAWALRIDDANIFLFELEEAEGGGWSGTWARPGSFVGNGVVFSQMVGVQQLQSTSGRDVRAGVELTFTDQQPDAEPEILRLRLVSENQAELTRVGTSLAPYPLVRVHPGTALGPFEAGRIYDRDNAAIEADYVPAPVLPPEEPAKLASPSQDASDEDGAQDELPRITPDFLDDL